MKFEKSVLQKEGFDAVYRITLENGLVLSSENVIWLGKRKADEIQQQFKEFVDFLEKANSDKNAEKE
jgi:hypothetical protein